MNLTQIQQKILSQANKELPNILGNVFIELKNRYITKCCKKTCGGCAYCSLLTKYVAAKRLYHSNKKQRTWEIHHPEDWELDMMKNSILELKQERRNVKNDFSLLD